MTLAELIETLEAADPNLVLPHGFTNPHSYRGYYEDLAFEPASNVTVAAMLADARSALGTTYEGWKGGDFEMREYTDCWLAVRGSTGESLGPVLLGLMLTVAQIKAEERNAEIETLRTERDRALSAVDAVQDYLKRQQDYADSIARDYQGENMPTTYAAGLAEQVAEITEAINVALDGATKSEEPQR